MRIEKNFNISSNINGISEIIKKNVLDNIIVAEKTESEKKWDDPKWNWYIALGLFLGIIPGLIIYQIKKTNNRRFIDRSTFNFSWNELVVLCLSNYENITNLATEKSLSDIETIVINNWPSFVNTKDTQINNVIPCVRGTLNGLNFKTYLVEFLTIIYVETTDEDGNKHVDEEYEYTNTFALIADGFNTSFNDLQFCLKPAGSSFLGRKKTIRLENENFNHSYCVDTNNEVKSRKLLTPSTQEVYSMLPREERTFDITIANSRLFYIDWTNGDDLAASTFDINAKIRHLLKIGKTKNEISDIISETIKHETMPFIRVFEKITAMKNLESRFE